MPNPMWFTNVKMAKTGGYTENPRPKVNAVMDISTTTSRHCVAAMLQLANVPSLGADPIL